METGHFLYAYNAINNEIQKISTYYAASDIEQWCDRALSIPTVRKGIGRYYIPAIKASFIADIGKSEANYIGVNPKYSISVGGDWTATHNIVVSTFTTNAAATALSITLANIKGSCAYGAKEDNWCWTRVKCFVDGTVVAERYLTKSNGGSFNISLCANKEVIVPAGNHTVSFSLHHHASSGDGLSFAVNNYDFVVLNKRKMVDPSDVRVTLDGIDYYILKSLYRSLDVTLSLNGVTFQNGNGFPETTIKIGTITSSEAKKVKVAFNFFANVNEPRDGTAGIRIIAGSVIGPSCVVSAGSNNQTYSSNAVIDIPAGTTTIYAQGYKPSWQGYYSTSGSVTITDNF